jgi:hypothetical protein
VAAKLKVWIEVISYFPGKVLGTFLKRQSIYWEGTFRIDLLHTHDLLLLVPYSRAEEMPCHETCADILCTLGMIG